MEHCDDARLTLAVRPRTAGPDERTLGFRYAQCGTYLWYKVGAVKYIADVACDENFLHFKGGSIPSVWWTIELCRDVN